eukprot:CAMPEP_0178931460 /NCGR_PEP_ID=MMETSP0786-20121207/21927_1 /TAXON_ID=186022 /ORGANISM="Thalassionema frauenfeldii, Strain CCMP 1798" /LENGTH=320 /DNA_ID=CAMNT_0020608349 /DNA_START=148 /DNA_END=1110 /DNA_ORIENTATION=-
MDNDKDNSTNIAKDQEDCSNGQLNQSEIEIWPKSSIEEFPASSSKFREQKVASFPNPNKERNVYKGSVTSLTKGQHYRLELAPPFPESTHPDTVMNSNPKILDPSRTSIMPQPGAYDVQPGGSSVQVPRRPSRLSDHPQHEEAVEQQSIIRSLRNNNATTGMLPIAAEVVVSSALDDNKNNTDIEDQVQRYLDKTAVTAEVVSRQQKQRHCRRKLMWLFVAFFLAIGIIMVAVLFQQGSNNVDNVSSQSEASNVPTVSPTATQEEDASSAGSVVGGVVEDIVDELTGDANVEEAVDAIEDVVGDVDEEDIKDVIGGFFRY